MPATLPSDVYDFIIVGAGPAGCALASALATSVAAPKVLLVEAGDGNQDEQLRIAANRHIQHRNPSQSWGYTSAPEPNLDDRVLDLARGKGLGGSSAVNFTVWTEGPRGDMDRMAKFTDDDSWGWEKVKERYRRLTTQSMDTGSLRVGYAAEYNSEIVTLVDHFASNGIPLQTTANGDTPMGMAIYPVSSYRGRRSTAADLLHKPPQNITILTNCTVHRIIFDGNVATGVATHDGQILQARKEVIISSGTMESPKILMHSGIGPSEQLTEFGIPVLYSNPHVGQNFQDHVTVMLRWQRTELTSMKSPYFRDEAAKEAAINEWKQFGTGPYAYFQSTPALGFFKSNTLLASDEFAALPSDEQEHIKASTIPTHEICLTATTPEYDVGTEDTPATITVLLILQNLQSRGSFTLQSSDPSVPLLFKTGYLEHPFDRKLAIESMRETMDFMRSDSFQKHYTVMSEPESTSDDDILRFWRKNAGTCWHMSSTCSMGIDNDGSKGGVVDRDFQVYGTQRLRIVDCSVFPFLPSTHIQAHAYQIGMIAAEKILKKHELS
ncbi:hypothetical protein NQ176_g7879 [Zarea fungicola]|uniref:Uncharacterized protein n=1 Tax=Zarea fungicola TaxID=93591 RepID=A0ACC1MXS4_9HYPO|nr:hypothetical protein NQ176_g7879 [Lecanicillium fungicola]